MKNATTKPQGALTGRAEDLLARVANVPYDQTSRLPKKLSPSRASQYKKCPQAFFYQTIAGIKQPTTAAMLRGTLAHACCERIFDHPRGERTPELALTYLRPAWEEMVNPDLTGLDEAKAGYATATAESARSVAEPGTDEERELLASAEECVRSWFNMERVNNFSPTELELPDGRVIDGRELYVWAELAGVTAHGFVDRLDRYETPAGTRWSVSDYKTSAQAPWLKNPKWPADLVARIKNEQFFQLRVYAALLWHLYGIKVSLLRLVYIATGDRENGIGTERVTQQSIDETVAELESLWRQMKKSASTGNWPTKTGPLCQWCYFHDICPAWSDDVSDIVAETEN